METVAVGIVGFTIGLVVLFVLGPFLVYSVIKVVGFENPTLFDSFKYYASQLILLVILGLSLGFLLGLVFPVPADATAATTTPAKTIQSLAVTAAALFYMKYWFGESWGKVIFASIALQVLTFVALFAIVMFTIVIFAG